MAQAARVKELELAQKVIPKNRTHDLIAQTYAWAGKTDPRFQSFLATGKLER